MLLCQGRNRSGDNDDDSDDYDDNDNYTSANARNEVKCRPAIIPGLSDFFPCEALRKSRDRAVHAAC